MLLWGEGKQTKASTCEGTSCVEKTIAPKCPLRSHNDMRRCRPNLTLPYCVSSFSVLAIFLNLLLIFLLFWFSAAFLNFFDDLSQSLDCWQSFSSGGDGNLPRPRRWAGLGAHQGGQNHPQGESSEPAMKEFTYKENICSGDEKVPGRRPRSINGPALRGSLSKHPITGGTLKRRKWRFFTWFWYLLFCWHCPLFAGLVLWPLSKLAPATSLARLAFLKYVILARGCASPSCGLSPSQVPRPTCQCHFRRGPCLIYPSLGQVLSTNLLVDFSEASG